MATTEGLETVQYENEKETSSIPKDWLYYFVHIVAWVILIISITCSITVIIWQQRTASAKNLFQRKIGERLVVYLAITDLLFSVVHFGDHLLIVTGGDVPPRIPCIIFAAVLGETVFAQSLVVLLTAASLCLLVSCNRKITFGPYDVGLLLFCHGIPIAVMAFAGVKDYLGFSGYWCFFNPELAAIIKVQAILQIIVFIANIALYSIVWLKIMRSSRRLRQFEGTDASKNKAKEDKARSHMKTAKILTLFVVVFFVQWWPSIGLFGIWTFFGVPDSKVAIAGVIFPNLGGLFNMLAYTKVRRWS